MTYDVTRWSTAHGLARSTGQLKAVSSDFKVTERLPETPSGSGEHLWLRIVKDGQNTAWVARQISKWAGVKPRDVSYAGLKDRHAVTEQTFSVHLPGKQAPSVHLLHIDGVTVLDHSRNDKKLRTGQLIGNEFSIRIRGIQKHQLRDIESQWSVIAKKGVPNYFGAQRFGHLGQNVETGVQWLLSEQKLPRHQQSIYVSAVRSFLFNEILSNRIQQHNWDRPIDGDFLQFTEGKTGFYAEKITKSELQRASEGQLSPCASLVGRPKERFAVLDDRETNVLSRYSDICTALEMRGLVRQFRKMRVIPENPQLTWVEDDPVFKFFLPAGSYATSVLNEMFVFDSSEVAGDYYE